MRCVSQSAEKQRDVDVILNETEARIYIRTNHEEVPDTGEQEGTHWECEEAYMECPVEEAPSVGEIEDEFNDWFEYAAEWQPGKTKSLGQLQADIEYIAAMTGIELEG